MDRNSLEKALTSTRSILVDAITTSSYKGKKKANGQEAKNAAIRSSAPINQIHQLIRDSIREELILRGVNSKIWPPHGSSKPELKITGLLKSKKQDVSVTINDHKSETITTGANIGETDRVGLEATNSALVIGIRSQLSSVDKNFDTLAERAFAETLNLRLRAPQITIGEVYVLPVQEFDDESLKKNIVGFKKKKINASKFVSFFESISRSLVEDKTSSIYKYDGTALIIADFKSEKVKVLWDEKDFIKVFGKEIPKEVVGLLPSTFIRRIIDAYIENTKG
jgi:hypothetical protein